MENSSFSEGLKLKRAKRWANEEPPSAATRRDLLKDDRINSLDSIPRGGNSTKGASSSPSFSTSPSLFSAALSSWKVSHLWQWTCCTTLLESDQAERKHP